MSTTLLLSIALVSVILLLLLVIKAKVHPFIALLVASLFVAITTGIPAENIMKVILGGMGSLLGSIAAIIVLGAILGAIIETSGGADRLANRFAQLCGPQRMVAALTTVAFILGLPVFFDVGFIIVVPLIYGFTKVMRVSPLKFGLPMAGMMLMVHVTVPTHPGPAAAAGLLNVDPGWLMMTGIALSIPTGIAGYFVAKALNLRKYHLSVQVLEQLQLTEPNAGGQSARHHDAPGALLISGLIVLPILLIMLGTLLPPHLTPGSLPLKILTLVASPAVALLITLALAGWLLGLRRGWTAEKLETLSNNAISTAAGVILVSGAGGAFGKVLVESGVGKALATSLQTIHLPLIPAAFILSLALRASQGSATVAIVTTCGLLSTAVAGLGEMQLVLVALSACFGALGLSHVNDSGFWVVTRYLGLSVADGLRSWTVLTTLMGLCGFALTWLVWVMI
ncbi:MULTISPECIES: GntP family transporter [unclassified Pantoea]|jgi:GntP family gluconate:H+ symporter|uniref:GntP family transporter n=1 Tax=unclassified Pantoea TaxID=2630326 RepID=UPI0021C56919|nr:MULTISPECIES: GntP family transporter [unclassified Pantoea]